MHCNTPQPFPLYVCVLGSLPSPCMYLFSNFVFSKFPQIPVFSCLLPRLELAIQSLVNNLFKSISSYCAKLQKKPIHILSCECPPALCGTCSLETGAWTGVQSCPSGPTSCSVSVCCCFLQASRIFCQIAHLMLKVALKTHHYAWTWTSICT